MKSLTNNPPSCSTSAFCATFDPPSVGCVGVFPGTGAGLSDEVPFFGGRGFMGLVGFAGGLVGAAGLLPPGVEAGPVVAVSVVGAATAASPAAAQAGILLLGTGKGAGVVATAGVEGVLVVVVEIGAGFVEVTADVAFEELSDFVDVTGFLRRVASSFPSKTFLAAENTVPLTSRRATTWGTSPTADLATVTN